jgi:ribonuclease P protein component
VIPRVSRLSTAAEFSAVVRRGVASSRSSVVVHVGVLPGDRRGVGLAVSRSVGGAVVRNRVKRRLRAILASRLESLPERTGCVVRALPSAGAASFGQLEDDVDAAFARAIGKLRR